LTSRFYELYLLKSVPNMVTQIRSWQSPSLLTGPSCIYGNCYSLKATFRRWICQFHLTLWCQMVKISPIDAICCREGGRYWKSPPTSSARELLFTSISCVVPRPNRRSVGYRRLHLVWRVQARASPINPSHFPS